MVCFLVAKNEKKQQRQHRSSIESAATQLIMTRGSFEYSLLFFYFYINFIKKKGAPFCCYCFVFVSIGLNRMRMTLTFAARKQKFVSNTKNIERILISIFGRFCCTKGCIVKRCDALLISHQVT